MSWLAASFNGDDSLQLNTRTHFHNPPTAVQHLAILIKIFRSQLHRTPNPNITGSSMSPPPKNGDATPGIAVGIIGMGDMGKMYARGIAAAGWR